MNELIRELAEQANADIWGDKASAGRYFDIERFAELIVRECVDCLRPLSRNHSMVGAAQDTIKEHFGVAE